MNALAMHEQKKNYITFLIVFVIEIIYKMVNFTVNKQITLAKLLLIQINFLFTFKRF